MMGNATYIAFLRSIYYSLAPSGVIQFSKIDSIIRFSRKDGSPLLSIRFAKGLEDHYQQMLREFGYLTNDTFKRGMEYDKEKIQTMLIKMINVHEKKQKVEQ